MADTIDCTLPENMEMDECHMDQEEGSSGPDPVLYAANINVWLMAGFQLSYHALQMFRYRSDALAYYTLGDSSFASGTSNTNYWKMSNSVRQSGSIAIWSILFFFQTLSIGWFFVDLNVMLWHYLVPAWMLVQMVAGAIAFYGYETAYSYY